MIQKYFFHNKANYNSKETKITSMTKKSHRAPTCAELGPAQRQLVSFIVRHQRLKWTKYSLKIYYEGDPTINLVELETEV